MKHPGRVFSYFQCFVLSKQTNNYLKSEICYYALQGIKSDYHYHLQLNITVDGERIVIPALLLSATVKLSPEL